MSQIQARQAGSAFIWKGIQLGGNKLIFLIRTIILARILAPEDFGLMALAMIAVDFLTGITELGMIPALVQRDLVDERYYNAAWTVAISRAVTISGLVFGAAPLIAGIFAEPRAVNLIRIAAIRPLLEAGSSIKVAHLTRELHFRSITILKLADALVNTLISITLAYRLGVWALLAGTLAGQCAYLSLSYTFAPHRPRFLFDQEAIKSLVNFGQWIFLTSVITVTGSSLVQVVISRRLGVAELGIYYLAIKLAFIPSEISSEVIGSVAFPLYARLKSDLYQAARVFRSLLSGMCAVVLPTCCLLIALAPSIIEELLGEKWQGTAPVIRLLAIVNIIGLFGDSVTPVLKGFGQPYKVAIADAFQYTLLIGLIWSLTEQFGVSGAALAWLISVGLTQGISALFLKQILPDPLLSMIKPFFLLAVPPVVGASLAVGIVQLLPGLPGLILALLISIFVIGLFFLFFDRTFKLNLQNDFFKAFPQLAAIMKISPIET